MKQFNGIKVFSATMYADRQVLGEKITAWLTEKRKSKNFALVEMMMRQSSDSAFHCVTCVVMYFES